MSTAILRSELLTRDDRELIPDFFTYDLLIVLIRDMTFIARRRMPTDEMLEAGAILRAYIRRVVLAYNERYVTFLDNDMGLYFECMNELYDYLQEELVSRLTDCILREKSFDQALGDLIEVYLMNNTPSVPQVL
jgi:hypothetical protein